MFNFLELMGKLKIVHRFPHIHLHETTKNLKILIRKTMNLEKFTGDAGGGAVG